MVVMRTFDEDKREVLLRKFSVEITREQEHAVMEEARRWEMIESDMLQFILRWGFEMYFRR